MTSYSHSITSRQGRKKNGRKKIRQQAGSRNDKYFLLSLLPKLYSTQDISLFVLRNRNFLFSLPKWRQNSPTGWGNYSLYPSYSPACAFACHMVTQHIIRAISFHNISLFSLTMQQKSNYCLDQLRNHLYIQYFHWLLFQEKICYKTVVSSLCLGTLCCLWTELN